MFTDSLWVQKVDHRISTALILFLLLLLLGNGRRRRGFFRACRQRFSSAYIVRELTVMVLTS